MAKEHDYTNEQIAEMVRNRTPNLKKRVLEVGPYAERYTKDGSAEILDVRNGESVAFIKKPAWNETANARDWMNKGWLLAQEKTT